MEQKRVFVERMQLLSEQLAAVTAGVRDLKRVYVDRGYAADEKDPITNTDIESTGATVTKLDASIVMFQQVLNFVDDNAVTQGNYGETINDMRRDV